MSKQSEAKKQQRYRTSPRTCGNCRHRSYVEHVNEYLYIEEKNNRCVIGGFAVKKTTVCDMWAERGD